MSTGQRFAIAGVIAAAILGGLAFAVSHAYFPVRPYVQCVMPLGNGATVAFFGYENELDEPREVPIGDDNRFTPGDVGRGQPTRFAPGATAAYPDSAFSVTFDGPELVWHLGPRAVSASQAHSPACPEPTKIKPLDAVAMVLPKKPEPPPEPPPGPPPLPPEPKPVEKVTEQPDPAKEATRKPKNQVKEAGQVKPKDTAKKPVETKQMEPIPLQLEGLTPLDAGIQVQTGDTTVLGNPEVEATETNTNIELVKDPDAVPDKVGDGTGGGEQVVRCTGPTIKRRVKGVYPDDAPRLGRTVLVRLLLTVDEEGRVTQASVTRSAGGAFDREAISVGKKLAFTPAECNGQPVEKRIPWVVEFTPDEW